MEPLNSNTYWMAAGEIGAVIGAITLAALAFVYLPVSLIIIKLFVAYIVYAPALDSFLWFVHLGSDTGRIEKNNDPQ